MATIADSAAFRDEGRLLAQHQAALTLLQGMLGDPALTTLRWLDLACGRGQIIAALEQNLSIEARSRISYYAYDAQQRFVREVERAASKLGLRGVEAKIGDLEDFSRILDPDDRFDFITLTNTVHEVGPAILPFVLVDCIARLTTEGCLFVYDMESLDPLELGAIPWSRDEFADILEEVFRVLGITRYRPEVGQWRHKSCNGWNVQVRRQHIILTAEDLCARRNAAAEAGSNKIKGILQEKLSSCRQSLEGLTVFGPETAEEEQSKVRLLYSFWSLNRGLGKLE